MRGYRGRIPTTRSAVFVQTHELGIEDLILTGALISTDGAAAAAEGARLRGSHAGYIQLASGNGRVFDLGVATRVGTSNFRREVGIMPVTVQKVPPVARPLGSVGP